MNVVHVLLDAYAVLAVLRDEPASDEVAELVAAGSAVSTINAAEVLDRLCRTGTPEDEVKADLASVGAELLQPPGDVVIDAGLLRAKHYHHRKRPVSLADCVAASHAMHLDIPLATSDGPLAEVLRAEDAAVTPLPDSRGVRPARTGHSTEAEALTPARRVLAVDVDDSITCIDCGERAHRLSYPPEDGNWQPGEIVSYRCSGCGDRWDIEVPEEDEGFD